MEDYFASMADRAAIPTREDDARLARLAQAGDMEARDALVLGHWGFVVMVAKRYRRSAIPLEDLVNEGVAGMLRALETFDPDRGLRFCTYAGFWVRQTIRRAIAHKARLVRVPGWARAAPERVASLDAPLPEEGSLGDLFEGRAPSPVEEAHDSEYSEAIDATLARLRPREAQVLRLRFGLADGREHTLEEIGRILRVTRERARQIQFRALARLRLRGALPAA